MFQTLFARFQFFFQIAQLVRMFSYLQTKVILKNSLEKLCVYLPLQSWPNAHQTLQERVCVS